jgi:hypothetical protein
VIIRGSIVFVVVGLLLAAVLYDRVDEPAQPVAAGDQPIVTPSVSDPARLDGAWYCPMGSSSPGGFADHQVQLANLSSEPSVANVNILTGEGKGPSLRVDLAPLSTQEVSLSSIAQADVAGAVVEMVGGTGVVAHALDTEQGRVEGSCATHVSSSWYFASGRTTRDSREYLALMNPFPEDVVYNAVFYRAAGRPRLPAELQGGVIPANSVQIIEVESYVAREEAVAAAITTVRGRLVVERLQVLNGELGPSGAALQLGVTAPASSWMLAAGRIHEGGDDRVVVFNPSAEETANVNVELWPVNPTDRSLYGLGAIPRELLPGRFEVIDLRVEADRFGLRLPFEVGVSVTSGNGEPIVAERWLFATEIDTSLIGAGGTGVAPSDDAAAAEGEDAGAATGDAAADDAAAEEAAGGEAAGDEAAAGAGEGEPGDGEPVGGELDIPGIFGGESEELAQPTATVGVATSRGTEVLSRRWVIPWLPTPTANSTVITVTSPNEATIEVFALVNGELQGPFRASIAPGGRAIVPISLEAAGAPVLVVSDAAVAVEAQVVVVDQQLSTVPGIPTVDQ